MLKILKSHLLMSALVYGGAIITLAAALWIAWQYADPAPPTKVTIAAGSPTGAYFKYARQYAEYFAKQGIELEIIETNGSMDNLERMSAADSKVDAAFMQGGIATPEQHPDLRSLGSLYYEPLWVFYRKDLKVKKISDMKGLRIAIGPEGSGTNFVISRILSENGIEKDNTKLMEVGAATAIPALRKDEIDVLFLIAGVKSKVIETLSDPSDNIELMSFDRAEAYSRSHHYLQRLILPHGALDLANDLPSKDISMLAPTANLVVRDDIHAAIKYLFLLAAADIHMKGDIFAMPGTFPNNKGLLFPLTDEAASFYKNGAPFLMRFLPYALAVNLERLKILLIPLLTLLYPLFKVTPPAYRWQIRRRIFKWYKHLKELDIEAYDITTLEQAQNMRARLEELDRQVMETSVPLSYSDYIYSLRLHVHLIQDRLDKIDFDKKAEA
ncbi:TAXI family TRAP transporter solute-binding subunit [Pseudodesulfovibrio sp. zrk46]|uniref:TAXI family TRAP transporter solute-binding subunit n=1 Tax=Pseudodesulfovibrio sp. zrk46 TaxID=2725288 RepID=UPI001449C729|nr:TAXI family TRAP transporter solute-binding subunit [Pseudodesulfovibrio sp. zrk46]QJB55868.1 TAXI family TRAP transporter solute-binding subunit [Pseudodesulfovibrio sp. zrk46]